jgi:hypothetical protein
MVDKGREPPRRSEIGGSTAKMQKGGSMVGGERSTASRARDGKARRDAVAVGRGVIRAGD